MGGGILFAVNIDITPNVDKENRIFNEMQITNGGNDFRVRRGQCRDVYIQFGR